MSDELQLNLNEAWDFVSSMSRGRPMHLVAIGEAGGVMAATFEPNEISRLTGWITDQSGKNIYFHVNPLRVGVKNKKASKGDVEVACCRFRGHRD